MSSIFDNCFELYISKIIWNKVDTFFVQIAEKVAKFVEWEGIIIVFRVVFCILFNIQNGFK